MIYDWLSDNLFLICLPMSSFTKKNRSQKHKRGKDPLIDGEPDSAQVVTHTTIKVTLNDGSTSLERVLVPLDAPSPTINTIDHMQDISDNTYDIDHDSPHPDRRRTNRVFI
jgi:hypothetical protein